MKYQFSWLKAEIASLPKGSSYEVSHRIQSFDQTNRGLVDRMVVGSEVNAQKRTRERLIESLQIGAKEMLETEIMFESDTIMTTIDIPMPHWAEKARAMS